jgi:hypothetical protein
MRYMLLIHRNEESAATASVAEMDERMTQVWSVIDEMTKQGVFRGAEPLERAGAAAIVRVHDGKTLATDGPFAETKEQLGGYYILDCKSLDEAVAWAAQIPVCGGSGCVEVRPILALPARPERPQSEHASAVNASV